MEALQHAGAVGVCAGVAVVRRASGKERHDDALKSRGILEQECVPCSRRLKGGETQCLYCQIKRLLLSPARSLLPFTQQNKKAPGCWAFEGWIKLQGEGVTAPPALLSRRLHPHLESPQFRQVRQPSIMIAAFTLHLRHSSELTGNSLLPPSSPVLAAYSAFFSSRIFFW